MVASVLSLPVSSPASPAPCVPPVSLGFCPLCLSAEVRRELVSGSYVFMFLCGSRLDTPDSSQPVITSSETCTQGYVAELVGALRQVSEVAENWPPTTGALEAVESIVRAKLGDLSVYRIR